MPGLSKKKVFTMLGQDEKKVFTMPGQDKKKVFTMPGLNTLLCLHIHKPNCLI
jgi:hypothetical protein